MPRLLTILTATMLLAACASTTDWAHPDKGTQAFQDDRSHCWERSKFAGGRSQPTASTATTPELEDSAPAGPAGGHATQRYDRFERCMFRRGWHKV